MQPSNPSRRQLLRTLVVACFGWLVGAKATPAETPSTPVPTPPVEDELPPFSSPTTVTYSEGSQMTPCASEEYPWTVTVTCAYTGTLLRETSPEHYTWYDGNGSHLRTNGEGNASPGPKS